MVKNPKTLLSYSWNEQSKSTYITKKRVKSIITTIYSVKVNYKSTLKVIKIKHVKKIQKQWELLYNKIFKMPHR